MRRLIIEKPFGVDLASAQALNRELLEVLDERQIYRIDHYLGKETVQNIWCCGSQMGCSSRFGIVTTSTTCRSPWRRPFTVGKPGPLYDETGALRDMVPNHLFQLLSLVAMEPPSRFEPMRFGRKKHRRSTRSTCPVTRRCCKTAYARNMLRPGWVTTKSRTIAEQDEGRRARQHDRNLRWLKLMIDNWRWAGVPFYLRTGKRSNPGGPRLPSSSNGRRLQCSGYARRSAGTELSGHEHPAGRMHRAAIQRESARARRRDFGVNMTFKYQDYSTPHEQRI